MITFSINSLLSSLLAGVPAGWGAALFTRWPSANTNLVAKEHKGAKEAEGSTEV